MSISGKRLDMNLDKLVQNTNFLIYCLSNGKFGFGKASFCDPNVFSSSYLPAIVICRLLFTNKNVGRIFFFFQCVQCAITQYQKDLQWF